MTHDDHSRHADFILGQNTARIVLAELAPADRDEFIAEELSDEGKARGREIDDQPELFHLGWEHALEEARS